MKPGWIKKSVAVLWVFLFLSQLSLAEHGQDQQQRLSSLITSVVLVDRPDWLKLQEREREQTPPLPGLLNIGIDANRAAFFKLTLAAGETKVFITAGHLQRGMNMVALPAGQLFAGSGSHQYLLEVKAGETEEQVNIRLEIKIKSLAAGSSQEETGIDNDRVKVRLYEISLLVGNRLISSILKKDDTLAGLKSRGLKQPAPVRLDPRYPVPGTRPPAVAVSPLALAFKALKGIRNRAKQRQQEKIRQVYKTQITGVFLRKIKSGKEEPLRVTIKITQQKRPTSMEKKKDEGITPSAVNPQR